MTREHKLALIVGFAFVLVVGVLLSDHFSSARKTQPKGDLLSLGSREAGSATMSLDQPSASRLGERVNMGSSQDRPFVLPEKNPRVPTAVSGAWGTSQGQVGRPVNDPLAAQDDGYAAFTDDRNVRPMTASEADTLAQYFDPPQVIAMVPPTNLSGAAGGAERANFNPLAVETSTVPGGVVPGLSNFTRDRLAETDVATREQPKARTYTAREGDSLYAIARRELGDGTKWLAVRDLNRKLVGDEGEYLQPGMKLVLPGAAKAETVAPSPVGSGQSASSTRPVKTPTAGGNTYTVQRGDVLSVIAQKTLGSARRWPEIVAANRGSIEDPETLSVGMVLKIPAK